MNKSSVFLIRFLYYKGSFQVVFNIVYFKTVLSAFYLRSDTMYHPKGKSATRLMFGANTGIYCLLLTLAVYTFFVKPGKWHLLRPVSFS